MQRALARSDGNVSAAAEALGISRATLHRKLRRLDLHARALGCKLDRGAGGARNVKAAGRKTSHIPPLRRSRLAVAGRHLLIHAKSQDRSSATYPEGSSWCRHGGGTMKAALQNYQARMRRVLDHIDRHLDRDLDLETVSGVAAFSKFHFHRQFTATFGLSVHRYVQLARMKRASHRLAYMDAQSVTDIAMDAGYDAPDASPAPFGNGSGNRLRRSGVSRLGAVACGLRASRQREEQAHAEDFYHRRRDDFDVPPTPVAIMEHRGDPATLGATIQRFIAWRKAAGLPPGQVRPSMSAFRAASCVACRL